MPDSWTTQWRKGLLEYCVLLVLRHGESYGYEVVESLRSTGRLDVSESTVYPILNRLYAERCLRVRMVSSTEGPPRRYYTLTAAGRVRLAEMEQHWSLLDQTVHQLKTISNKGNDDEVATGSKRGN